MINQELYKTPRRGKEGGGDTKNAPMAIRESGVYIPPPDIYINVSVGGLGLESASVARRLQVDIETPNPTSKTQSLGQL